MALKIHNPEAEVQTVKLASNGKTVLAKKTKYGLSAVQYSNRTQAYARQDKLRAAGVACAVIHGFGRPFYVAINQEPAMP